MRYLVKVSYNGRQFHGFQSQKKERTVQDEIEKALKRMHKVFIRIHPAGRTDAGVHALEQYFHFDSHIELAGEKWKYAMNSGLPDDILVKSVTQIEEDYHVRYHSHGKAYRYKIYQGEDRNPFMDGLKLHYPYPLDEYRMKEVMRKFTGTHDFTSFSSAKSAIEDKVRHIYQFDLIKTTDGYDFLIIGSGFLYNMVRILVAYVLEVGQGRWNGENTEAIIQAKDRKLVPKTAPAEGLYLECVFLTRAALSDRLEEIENKDEKH
ncbi:tRNA pseudouridine(38-40) synthase TruA [Salinicoccus albus]|uniref:tRNA pseudouridine(38-40) synthase TruA n=1 Tax=Salinicoccus albus TaxID=418756 RepID=UPI00035EBBEE|nr:tRNA pseudouridine(38-40) synthase TruA [Salinicoccus albus]